MRSSFSGTAAGADARGAANSPLGDSTWDSSPNCIHCRISLAVPAAAIAASPFHTASCNGSVAMFRARSSAIPME